MEIVPGKVYIHYKGDRYLVLCITEESTNTRDGERGVVYISLTYGIYLHREFNEFVEEVEWPDGTKGPRFILEEVENS